MVVVGDEERSGTGEPLKAVGTGDDGCELPTLVAASNILPFSVLTSAGCSRHVPILLTPKLPISTIRSTAKSLDGISATMVTGCDGAGRRAADDCDAMRDDAYPAPQQDHTHSTHTRVT